MLTGPAALGRKVGPGVRAESKQSGPHAAISRSLPQPSSCDADWKTSGLRQSLAPKGPASADARRLWSFVKIRGVVVAPGKIITTTSQAGKQLSVLLSGRACTMTRDEGGGRQIFAFHHPGDLLALGGVLHPGAAEHIEVEALSHCSVGTIDRDELEQAIQCDAELAKALWRLAMTEAGTLRQRLIMARWPAQQRVAHLLCEQLWRLGTQSSSVIPLTQVEVADTVGLSAVHTNRVFQDLRKLGVLAQKRHLEVTNKERLQELASFDSRYLGTSESMAQWDLRFDPSGENQSTR